MACLVAVGTAVPRHEVTREETTREAVRMFGGGDAGRIAAIEALIERGTILHRRSVLALPELLRPRSISETARTFERESVALAEAAVRRALESAGRRAEEISLLVVTSATGFMIPSADAYLIDALGIPPSARRLPVGQLGCAAAVSGIARANELLTARPDGIAVLCSVELPTLSFRPDARRFEDLVAATLFGDGAAAVVLVPDAEAEADRLPASRRGPALALRASRSYLVPASRDLAAFRLTDGGFELNLGRSLPGLAAGPLPELCAETVSAAGRRVAELAFYAVHAGGRRVLDEVARALALPASSLWASWKVLREHGNMSSPTVLFALAEILGAGPGREPKPGDLGLLCAFGPGFSAEMVLCEALP